MSASRLAASGFRRQAFRLPLSVRVRRSERGYSLVEMLVSVAIMTTVTGAIFRMAGSSQSGFRTQPEVADMQQRLRVAADMIYKDLLMAGSGPSLMKEGALQLFFPPISPARRGLQNPDAELFHASDRVSILYAARSRAQVTLSADQQNTRSDLPIDTLFPSCPPTAPCGFTSGMRALVFDSSGVGAGFDVFSVTGVSDTDVQHKAPYATFSKAYQRASARLFEVEQHVYYLDNATKKLMHYDGDQSTVELVDNVVGLSFTYYADPDPNSAPQPGNGLSNCVYDAATPPVPKLTALGGTALKALTPAQLTDGPTCGISPNRFDGDLLRVRKVRVAIKVQVGREDLRGTSTEFANAGKSTGGQKYVPDYAVTFEVTPRNLNLIR